MQIIVRLEPKKNPDCHADTAGKPGAENIAKIAGLSDQSIFICLIHQYEILPVPSDYQSGFLAFDVFDIASQQFGDTPGLSETATRAVRHVAVENF